MKEDQISTTPRAKSTTLQLLDELLTREAAQDVGVRLWDGTLWPDDQPRLTTIVLNHPGAIRAMFASLNEVGLAEAFLYDDFDVEGDLAHVFGLADGLIKASTSVSTKLNCAALQSIRSLRPCVLFFISHERPDVIYLEMHEVFV